jgi:hypothetical protein
MMDTKRELCGAPSGACYYPDDLNIVQCGQPKGHDRGPNATDHVAVVVWSKDTKR